MSKHEIIEYKRYAIEKYLEQIKVLTTLASALLFSPGLLLILLRLSEDINLSDKLKFQISIVILLGCLCSLLSIISAYFIYSSLVGTIYSNHFDINRKATKVLSLAQFILVIMSCIFFVILLIKLLYI